MVRKADKIKDWKQQLNDKAAAREDMFARLESKTASSVGLHYSTYTNTNSPYSKTKMRKEYPVEPALREQVEMLVVEVAKLVTLVDKQEADLQSWEHERGEWYHRLDAAHDKIAALEAELETQIDGVHEELKDMWEELE